MNAYTQTIPPISNIEEASITPKICHWLPHFGISLSLALLAYFIAGVFGGDRLSTCSFVITGALAGFLTNKLAVWLLLHPVKPLFRGKLHGIFFKHKAEFGEKTVDLACERFLTPGFMGNVIASSEVKRVIEDNVLKATNNLLSKDNVTLKSLAIQFTDEKVLTSAIDNLSKSFSKLIIHEVTTSVESGKRIELLQKFWHKFGNQSIAELSNCEALDLDFSEVLTQLFQTSTLTSEISQCVSNAIKGWENDGKTIGDFVSVSNQNYIEVVLLRKLQDLVTGTVATYLSCPSHRHQIGIAIQKECKRFMTATVDNLSLIKKTILTTFGRKDLEELVLGIPDHVDRYLLEVSQYLSGSELEAQITQFLKKRVPGFWNIKVSKILKSLPSTERLQVFSPFLDQTITKWLIPSLSESLSSFIQPYVTKPMRTQVADLKNILEHTKLNEILHGVLNNQDIHEHVEMFLYRQISSRVHGLSKMPLGKTLGILNGEDNLIQKIKEDLIPRLNETLISKTQDFAHYLPIKKELIKVWDQLSDAEIQESVHGTLDREFITLVNLGTSLGATMGFFISMMQLAIQV